jgi:hypothetical protein
VALAAAGFPNKEGAGFVAVAGVTTTAGIAGDCPEATGWDEAVGCVEAGGFETGAPKRFETGCALANALDEVA